jgi:photosystem II stability/assembly factor-like uncharacterized protein
VRRPALIVFVAIAAAGGDCSPVTEDPVPPGRIPVWENQHRLPTSSHLRAVRFWTATDGLVAGESTSFFRTRDGGATWTQLEHTPASRGGDAVALDVTGELALAAGSDAAGGKYWASNGLASFATPDAPGSGLPYTAVDLKSDILAYYLRSNGVVEVVQSGAVSTLDSNLGGTASALEFFVGTAAYVGGSDGGAGGRIRRLDIPGNAWATSALAVGAGVVRDFSMIDAANGYAVGDGATVLKTTDGLTWTDADPTNDLPGGLNPRGASFVDLLTGWIVGNSGNVWKTTDGGANWVQQALGTTGEDLYDVWFVDAQTGYAVGDRGTVLRCTGGGTWTNLTQGQLVRLNAVDFTSDGRIGLAVGNLNAFGSPVILRTLDGGASWSLFTSGAPSVNFTGVSIPRAGSRDAAYVCGESGALLRNLDLDGTGVWQAAAVPNVNYRAVLFPGSDSLGFCAGDGGRLLWSSTANLTFGVAWTQVGGIPNVNYLSLASGSGGLDLYAGGSVGTLLQSSLLAFTTWTALSTAGGPAGQSLQALQAQPNILFAGADGGNAWRLVMPGNFGSVWQASTPVAGASAPLGLAFTSPGYGAWVSNGIYLTQNGADPAYPWTLSPDHTKSTLRAVWMNTSGIGYAVGDDGTILRTVTGGR